MLQERAHCTRVNTVTRKARTSRMFLCGNKLADVKHQSRGNARTDDEYILVTCLRGSVQCNARVRETNKNACALGRRVSIVLRMRMLPGSASMIQGSRCLRCCTSIQRCGSALFTASGLTVSSHLIWASFLLCVQGQMFISAAALLRLCWERVLPV